MPLWVSELLLLRGGSGLRDISHTTSSAQSSAASKNYRERACPINLAGALCRQSAKRGSGVLPCSAPQLRGPSRLHRLQTARTTVPSLSSPDRLPSSVAKNASAVLGPAARFYYHNLPYDPAHDGHLNLGPCAAFPRPGHRALHGLSQTQARGGQHFVWARQHQHK